VPMRPRREVNNGSLKVDDANQRQWSGYVKSQYQCAATKFE